MIPHNTVGEKLNVLINGGSNKSTSLVNAGGEDRLDVRVNEKDKKKKLFFRETKKTFQRVADIKNKRT